MGVTGGNANKAPNGHLNPHFTSREKENCIGRTQIASHFVAELVTYRGRLGEAYLMKQLRTCFVMEDNEIFFYFYK